MTTAKQQLKVLLIHSYYQYRGGEDVVFERETSLLKDAGYDVAELRFNNIKLSFLKFLLLPFNPFSYFKVMKAIKRFAPDVVHIHNFFFAASPSILYAIRKCKKPCCVTVHNFRFFCPSCTLFHNHKLYSKGLKKGFPWEPIKDKVYRNSAMATFWVSFCYWLHTLLKTWNKIDALLFVNPYAHALMEQLNPLHYSGIMTVKENFMDDCAEAMLQRNSSFLYIGRLSEEKGIDTLLAAFKGINKNITIIGDGPLKNKVEQFASENVNCNYIGFQQKERIIQELKQCEALIVSSICMEMAPLTLVEAMACGTPVIASDVETLKSFISDKKNGILFRAGNEQSLQNAVFHFGSMPLIKKQAISKKARATYETYFTKEKSFTNLSVIYNGLINKSLNAHPLHTHT
jgi:glycosyltransferase involved in cell wall biosynthesis